MINLQKQMKTFMSWKIQATVQGLQGLRVVQMAHIKANEPPKWLNFIGSRLLLKMRGFHLKEMMKEKGTAHIFTLDP